MRRITSCLAAVTAAAFLVHSTSAAAVEALTSDPPRRTPSAPRVPTAPTALAGPVEEIPAPPEALVAPSAPVRLPALGTAPVVADAPGGRLTMTVPAAGPDRAPVTGSARYAGAAAGSGVTVQQTRSGLRALVHIRSVRAPERYAFRLGGSITSLRLTRHGGVVAYDGSRHVVAVASPPWARDARGRTVPTHYEIAGRTTLIQVVKHRGKGFTYGITADPSWLWWIKNITKCAVGVGALLAAPAVAANVVRILKVVRGSKPLRALVRHAGGLAKVVRAVARFAKKRGHVGRPTRSLVKAFWDKGGKQIIGMISGGCLAILKELV